MNHLLKYFTLLIILILHSDMVSQSSGFRAGVLFNANGIHIQGQDDTYWSVSSGTVWGTGDLSAGGFVKRNFSDHFYTSLELRYIQKGSLYEFLTDNGLQVF